MNPTSPPRIAPGMPGKRFGTVHKMAGIAVLLLLLLIPLAMIRVVVQERLGRRNEAIANITSTWGQEQNIIGPVLVVPYRHSFKSWKEQPTGTGRIEKVEVMETAVANAYFLPAHLEIQGTIQPTRLHRGIYEAVVYTGKLRFSGRFDRPDFARLRVEEKDVLWGDASVAFAIPDLRGVKEALWLNWGTNRLPVFPGTKAPAFASGVSANIAGLRENSGATPFGFDVELNGSGGINFAPVGAQTVVQLSSSWPDPSFRGAFLPAERQVTAEGFAATWRTSMYGRGYAQQWTDEIGSGGLQSSGRPAGSMLGVEFLPGIDTYRNAERAVKYGALFLALLFAAFFLFEILSALRIHPFQYALVGAAFCLFYLGLLSLSEFVAFGLAYLAVAAVTILLIGYYCLKVLRSGVRTMIIAGLLAAIFGFLYVALQLQDYALLFGTAGLFAVLAIVIVVTRNIDWYARDQA